MKVVEINVVAGRTFNHPHESYSNLRPEVQLRAHLTEGEDPLKAVKEPQQMAEGMVEDHKNGLLRSIEELHQLTEHQAELRGLQLQLKRAQDRMDEIRKGNPQLNLLQNVDYRSEDEQ